MNASRDIFKEIVKKIDKIFINKLEDFNPNNTGLMLLTPLRISRLVRSFEVVESSTFQFGQLRTNVLLVKKFGSYIYLINQDDVQHSLKKKIFKSQDYISSNQKSHYSYCLTMQIPPDLGILIYILMIGGHSEVDRFYMSNKLRFYFSGDPEHFDNDDPEYVSDEFHYWFQCEKNQTFHDYAPIAVITGEDDITNIYFHDEHEENIKDFLFLFSSKKKNLLAHLNETCIPNLLDQERYEDIITIKEYISIWESNIPIT